MTIHHNYYQIHNQTEIFPRFIKNVAKLFDREMDATKQQCCKITFSIIYSRIETYLQLHVNMNTMNNEHITTTAKSK